jgi:hypothetical protein
VGRGRNQEITCCEWLSDYLVKVGNAMILLVWGVGRDLFGLNLAIYRGTMMGLEERFGIAVPITASCGGYGQ